MCHHRRVRRPKLLLVAIAVATPAGLASARDARAADDDPGPVGEVALLGGFATRPVASSPTSIGINPVGGGIGARAGVAYRGFYFGASLADTFYGSTAPYPDSTTTLLMAGAEAGYGATIQQRWVVRPRLGLGLGIVASSRLGGTAAEAQSGFGGLFYVEPGFETMLLLGEAKRWFLGVDANVAIFVPGQDTMSALVMHGEVGVRF
jgi:hypothetical protein